MSTKQLIPEAERDPKRFLALQECEEKMRTGFRRGVEASRLIGEQLRKIDEQELWSDAGCMSFTDYIKNRLPMDPRSARRLMIFSRIADIFEERQLALPEYESQAVPLGKLADDTLVEVWQRVQTACHRRGEPITVFAVQQAVEDQVEQGDGITIDLDTNSSSVVSTATTLATPVQRAMDRPRFTERGEEALEKISRLCPAEVTQAIEHRTIPISLDDLITWADQDDNTIKTLAYYWADERWSIPKAIRFENRAINGTTDINAMVLLCRARGGRAVITHDTGEDTFRFIVEQANQI
jgi:hypothetical protein